MLKELHLDTDAPWKQRFRLPITSIGQIAPSMPTRGLVASNRSSPYQLNAWHVPTGEFSQLTERPEGVARGVLSPNGAFVYYLLDRKGANSAIWCGSYLKAGRLKISRRICPSAPVGPTP